jgi:hypothetical protein
MDVDIILGVRLVRSMGNMSWRSYPFRKPRPLSPCTNLSPDKLGWLAFDFHWKNHELWTELLYEIIFHCLHLYHEDLPDITERLTQWHPILQVFPAIDYGLLSWQYALLNIKSQQRVNGRSRMIWIRPQAALPNAGCIRIESILNWMIKYFCKKWPRVIQ